MSETDLYPPEQDTNPEPLSSAPESAERGEEDAAQHRRLPDRFLDEASGEIRKDALVQAYLDLEQQLESRPLRAIPASFEDYAIMVSTNAFTADPDVNKRLHEAGFDQDQAQLVYDLAASHLFPMVAEVASTYEAEGQIAKLRQDFGGEEQWREVSRQMKAWGESNLPDEVFAVLSSSREGVLAMHKMMAGDEPTLVANAATTKTAPTAAELKQLMRDPRYWRDQDKAFVERVRDGFRQIYDIEG